MIFFRRKVFDLIFVFFFTFVGDVKCFANPEVNKISGLSSNLKNNKVPDEDAVTNLLGRAEMEFSGDSYEGKVPVVDRIFDGLQAAASPLKLKDGTTIFWGFRYQEAPTESVVVVDSEGRVRMAGAVTDITRLTGSSPQLIATMKEYQLAKDESGGADASVVIFVRDERDLVTYLPLIKSWLQADLLGFNADCDSYKLVGACKLAQEIQIPITAYQIVGTGKSASQLRKLSIPELPSAPVPIKLFRQ